MTTNPTGLCGFFLGQTDISVLIETYLPCRRSLNRVCSCFFFNLKKIKLFYGFVDEKFRWWLGGGGGKKNGWKKSRSISQIFFFILKEKGKEKCEKIHVFQPDQQRPGSFLAWSGF